MDCGWIKLHRSVFESPDFHTPAERYAFIWLVAHAAWQPCEVRTQHRRTVKLERGQITASLRYLAEQWDMSKSAVSRFLDHLEKRDSIRRERGTAVEAGRLVITICNYERFQAAEQSAGQSVGHGWDTNRDTGGTRAGHNNEEGKNIRRKDNPPHPPSEAEMVSGADRADAAGETGGEKARRSQPKPRRARATYPERFERFWAAYPRKAGKAAAFEAWSKFDEEAQECALLAAPEFAADMAKEDRPPDKIPHAATWINQQRFTDYYTPEYDDAPQGEQQAGSVVDGEDRATDCGDVRSGGEELDTSGRPVRDAESSQSRALEGVGSVAPVLSPPQSSVIIDYEEGRARAVASRQFRGSDDVSVGFDRRSTVRAVGEFLSQLDPDAEHLAAAPSRAGASVAAGGRRH